MTTTTELRDVLVGLLDSGAVKFGNFKLKLHDTHPDAPLSPIYLDLRIVRSFPALLRKIAKLLGQEVARLSPAFVADVPTAATPLVAVIATSFDIPMLTPRLDFKNHGSGARIDGAVRRGSKVVLVDDLITTADSKIGAINLLRQEGLVVEDVVVLLDREQGGREQLAAADCQLHALLTLSQMLDLFVSEHRIEPAYRSAINEYLLQMRSYWSAV